MDYRKLKREARCEECEFYDYDEEYDTYTCHMNLDEDEFARLSGGYSKGCPYFRYYDEYKSTNNQI